jgi:PTH1 family peptidyl-tRNA hydrolase
VRPFGRRSAGRRDRDETGGRVDFLLIGLGNPGSRYAGTRHNIGFEIADELTRRWELPRARKKFGGLIAEGRTGPGGARVAVLLPQTFMNESGQAAGPARGSLGVPLEHVIAIHDEIDLPFGEIRVRLGGGLAGHSGLKSLDRGLGSRDFWRVRAGVGRPDSTEPEIVSRHVLGRFSEDRDSVRELIDAAAAETERLIERLAAEANDPEESQTDG